MGQRLVAIAGVVLLLTCRASAVERGVHPPTSNVISHRKIPLPGTRNQLPADWLRQLRRAMRRGGETPMPPQLPSLDQVSPETREWITQLQQQSLQDMAGEIAKGAGSAFDKDDFPRLGDLPQELLSEIPIPLPANTRLDDEQLRKMLDQYMRDRGRDGSSGTGGLADDSWQSDNIPPQDWLKRIAPYLDRDLASTLAQAADPSNGETPSYRPLTKTSLLPKSDGNNSRLHPKQSVTPSWDQRQKSFFEAIVKNVDQQGTSWLKRVTKKGDGDQTSLWKSMTAQASRKLRSWKSRFSRESRSVSKSLDSIEAPSQPPKMPNFVMPSLPAELPGGEISQAAWVIILPLVVVALIFARHRFAPGFALQRAGRFGMLTNPEAVVDRESFLGICHGILVQRLGVRCFFWNHRELFDSLAREMMGRRQEISQLSRIYEHVRYAPDGAALTGTQIEQARQLLSSIRNDSPVLT